MRLLLGNPKPKHATPGSGDAPHVTYITIPVSEGAYDTAAGADVSAMKAHVAAASSYGDCTTRLGDLGSGNQEAYLAVTHPGTGLWVAHADADPSFVSCEDDPVLEGYIATHYGCPAGVPADLEDSYYTGVSGRVYPPGVSPNASPDLNALITNVGRTLLANAIGGGQVGTTGVATATSATSLTNSSATWATNQWAGYRVYAGGVWANIISNTPTVLTADQWYNPATPGGAAGTTPSSVVTYLIADGGSVSNWFVALTGTNISPAATDTSLSGEETTNGLQRKIAPFAITSAVSPVKFTLTPVYTYTGATSVTVYAIGVLNSIVPGDTTDTMFWETSLSASATVNASGDQITVTETVTGP